MVTTIEFAEYFEVSQRNLDRDIEALCKVGRLILTMQEIEGDSSIMNVKIDAYKQLVGLVDMR